MSNLPFTLDQLLILRAIIDEGSFKKAAKKLYISQPAVSFQIQNLERQLNTPIFYRNKRKAYLTENGKVLKTYCIEILNLCEEACQSLEQLQVLQVGPVLIGASQTTGTYLMPRLMSIFHHKYPNIDIKLKIASTHQVVEAVQKNQIDLGIVEGEITNERKHYLNITKYAEDEIALILPLSHPFSSLAFIRKEDLYRLRFIITTKKDTNLQMDIERILEKNGIDYNYFKIEMELDTVEAVKNAVQAGFGAAFISVSAISKELELGSIHWAKIEGIRIKRSLHIITNELKLNANSTELLKTELLNMFINPTHLS